MRHLEDNLQCLDFILSPEDLEELDKISAIDLGFPHNFLASEFIINNVIGGGTKIM